MHGVIAAGSAPTAEAGAEILAKGGNAVDAAIAACFATAAGEPVLTSLAGGGVMIHRDAASGQIHVCDFFANTPRLAPWEVPGHDFRAVDLDFGPTKQRFFIGPGSAAVPGVIPGLCTALERWGSRPLAEVIAPACRFVREGVELGPYQCRATRLLEPILTASPEGRAIFRKNGPLLSEGDLFVLPQLADALEALAARGWRNAYEHLVDMMLAQFSPDHGGLITRADFDDYRVEVRAPLERRYRDVRVLTNPPPATGGRMIAWMLGLLENSGISHATPGTADHARWLCAAMATADEARGRGYTSEDVAPLVSRFRELHDGALSQPHAPPGP
jgi:gamma-glutamyltranspeptidase/glutathione hydrolase